MLFSKSCLITKQRGQYTNIQPCKGATLGLTWSSLGAHFGDLSVKTWIIRIILTGTSKGSVGPTRTLDIVSMMLLGKKIVLK